jgi:hypothetical protein
LDRTKVYSWKSFSQPERVSVADWVSLVEGFPSCGRLTFRNSLVEAAPPGKIFSIFTTGCTLDSMPPEMLMPIKHEELD